MSFLFDHYWFIIVIQVICIVHAFKKGLTNWIYLLIFLPAVGCLVYFIVEIFPLLKNGQLGFITDKLFTSTESISQLEKQLRISDTFSNRCNLAKGYASKNNYEKAIEIYESALTNIYQNDVEVLLQLGRLNFLQKNYDKAIHYLERAKTNNNNKFIRPDDELWLGISYLEINQLEHATIILKNHIQFNRTIDAMYYYAELLIKENKNDEAKKMLEDIIDQRDLIPTQNRKYYMVYISKAKKLLKSL